MSPTSLTPARTGQWALITGGSSGIGRAHAFELAKRGFDLILVGRDVARLDQTASEISANHGVSVHPIAQDLGEDSSAKKLIAAVGDREIGVYIAVAGEGTPGPFISGDLGSYLTCINVKVRTLMEVTHFVATAMRKRGRGAIMLVSSTGGLQGVGALANNSATEAYVLSLGEALHYELKPHGVTATVLLPGPTSTPGLLRMVPDPAHHPRGVMTPEATAREGIRALERGRPSHIASFPSRILLGVLPRNRRTALMSRMLGDLFQRSTHTNPAMSQKEIAS
jgi:short-subunit dehydrogenase